MQILPTLDIIDTSHSPREVEVIGIHSAKFDNEKSDDNIVRAIGRLGIADSSNSRLVVMGLETGKVLHTIEGCKSPQGVELISEKAIVVADTNNHCLKLVTLDDSGPTIETIFDFRTTTDNPVKRFS